MASPLIHHISVINRDSRQSFEFYHSILGLDFLLKTVNQDDLEMYHLFFGDTTGRPGTEYSVFEMKNGPQKKYGTNSLDRTVFAVPSENSLAYWEQRLQQFDIFHCGIEEYNGTKILRFEDQDGVQLGLTPVKRQEGDVYYPNTKSDVPEEHAIIGIDSIHCFVRYREASIRSFKQLFDVQVVNEFEDNGRGVTVITQEGALFQQQIHLHEDRTRELEVMGVGAIQHVALNAKNTSELLAIEEKIINKNIRYSGIKNREFFQSLYYREPNTLLIEVATEQIQFGKKPITETTFDRIPLYLPDFLEEKRAFIESKLS